ncbi:MAG: hypothetical protein ACI8W8_001457 [Rhodothermales bacterium]|jgi:hypothetical protein
MNPMRANPSACCQASKRSAYVLLLSLLIILPALADEIRFNADVRPILSDRCFACHGPDSASRKGDLRLDREADALSAIVRGNPAESELILRITHPDPEEVMPPPKAKLSVSPAEIATLSAWIEQGAKWEKHWAFIPPADSAGKHIDEFIRERLKGSGLHPSPPADPASLLRRLSFDLTGLPPTVAELDAFLANPGYEAAIDRLLADSAFGERMAVEWLDVARYGDTDGLFEDHPRSVHPWRDWVVTAFNDNLPYSDFISWQVAGDLLPEATNMQKTATGFLRHNSTSNEGGIIDEDYRIKYLVDRVNTTATAFLGLTLECAQCHDHKFDPMTQREYFEFGGFFNSLVGKGNTKGSTAPTLKTVSPSDAKHLAEITAKIATLDAEIAKDSEGLQAGFADWRSETAALPWTASTIVQRESVKPPPALLPAPTEDSPVSGRYVRIFHTAESAAFLTLSEVQIFSNGQNIASKGSPSQSSNYGGNTAAKAIDGDFSGKFAGCACTVEEPGSWWEIDLGSSQPIDAILVWNRHDCCPERLDKTSFAILDDARQEVARHSVDKAVRKNVWPVNPDSGFAVPGRYVRVALPAESAQFLTLGEVQIFSDGKNIARQGTPKQSSDFLPTTNGAANAINGNTSGSFAACACTTEQAGAWWEIDLGATQGIDSIVLWNRHDCCPERLDKASITILDKDRKELKRHQLAKAARQNPWVLNENAISPDDAAKSVLDPIAIAGGPRRITALRFRGDLSDVSLEVQGAKGKPRAIKLAAKWAKGLPLHPQSPIELKADETLIAKLMRTGERVDIDYSSDPRFAAQATLAPAAYHALIKGEDNDKLLTHYRRQHPAFAKLWDQRDTLQKEKAAIDKTAVVTMIAADGPMRKNYLLERGEYDKPGEEVLTAAPSSIMPWSEDLRRNRLGLAQWLTDPKNPLTARVAVNRYWQLIFGRGIVKTSEDFGTQGATPSHRALLDSLAVRFVESGWDVKALLKTMLMSATYRQSSVRPTDLVEIDPENALLSFRSRERLQAEFLRDHALAIGGGLVHKMGGPGVHPYQPAVLFGANAIGSSSASFTQSKGENLYRRSIYTYWKRQIPAANMRILGADGRTVCRTRRERTNTPLQALTLLNDPQFVEAARILAEHVMREADSADSRLALAFRLATSRSPAAAESAILADEFRDRLAEFAANAKSANAYLKVGDRPIPKDFPAPELAAYSALASLIINLDESQSKR